MRRSWFERRSIEWAFGWCAAVFVAAAALLALAHIPSPALSWIRWLAVVSLGGCGILLGLSLYWARER